MFQRDDWRYIPTLLSLFAIPFLPTDKTHSPEPSAEIMQADPAEWQVETTTPADGLTPSPTQNVD